MRAGAYTVQQTLTAEAASVLKHSLTLARRRGHAQVTPLHVAATLLTSRSTNLLRRACLNSQSNNSSSAIATTNNTSPLHHPLQCRALELCFNVALNRLPTTPAGPLLHGQATLSNALIAALKRAQAHQRRGCIENQNQNQHQQQSSPLLSIKVELEQLVISILDDPSVSRVMREAGFSSTAVKNSIDQDSSSSTSSVFQCYASSSSGCSGGGGVFSLPSSPSHHHSYHSFLQNHLLNFSSYPIPSHVPLFPPQKKVDTDDVKLVMEVMLGKKRKNVVIVGDSLSLTDGLVMELMRRLEKGDEVPEELKNTHFIKFQFAPIVLKYMKKEDVEMNVLELKKKVDSVCSGGSGGGVIICTGDLKWTLDIEKEQEKGELVTCYSPVNHLVSELGRLLSDYGSVGSCFSRSPSNNGISSRFNKVWLIGTASYQTYTKCQMKQPPLDLQWSLQAVSVPSGGLGLSLQAPSVHDSGLLETKPLLEEEHPDGLTCCTECKSNYEKEAEMFKSGSAQQKLLPSWLQQHNNATDTPSKDQLADLRKKWNRLCNGLHKDRNVHSHWSSTGLSGQIPFGKTYPYNSSCPWWPANSSFFPDASSISFSTSPLKPNSVPRFRRQNSCTIEFNGGSAWAEKKHSMELEPNLDVLKNMNSEGKEVKITLSLGNSLFADSGKLAEQNIERMLQRGSMRRLMQDNVPWQSESIPGIVEALVNSRCTNKDTWMLIQGNDSIGKRRLAHAIAESIFGSADSVLHLNMRMRGTKQISFSEMLTKAFRSQEKLLVLVENIDLADNGFLRLLAERFENGKFAESSKAERNSGQIIFLLTKGDSIFVDYQDGKKPRSVIQMALKANEIAIAASSFDNHKRRADWGLSKPSKIRRLGETEDSSLGTVENETAKKEFSRQSSFNTLDLNVKAEDEENETDEKADLSPISSDLTRESGGSDVQTFPITFLESIENRYTFNRSLTRDREMTELFMSKIKGSFDEVYCGGVNKVKFSFGDGILEEVLGGAGFFTNSLFEKWLKDIFQTSLMKIVKISGRDGIGLSVRLCSIGKEGEKKEEEQEETARDGFMKTCLPKEILVSFEY